MATTVNQKVIPISDLEGDQVEDDTPPQQENPSQNSKLVERKIFLSKRRMEKLKNLIAYSEIKASVRWLLDNAACNISISFEDITITMTFFVLFADDIRQMAVNKALDGYFDVAYGICTFTFIFELLAATWSKSAFTLTLPSSDSPYPQLKWEGYVFTFFWWLDLIAILSLFPDVSFISGPLGLNLVSNSLANGNYSKAGRVVRLVRLVRLIRLYKVAFERRAREQHEEELMELVEIGQLSYEEVAMERALYVQRQSRLGEQLSDSTTRRVIVMVLVILIILPLLLYSTNDNGPQFATTMLNKFNINTMVSNESKAQVLSSYVSGLQSTYNNRFIEYLTVEPLKSSSENPYIYYKSNLNTLRDAAKLNDFYYYTNTTTGVNYTTDAIYSLQSLVQQESLDSILTTIFIAIVLIGGAMIFTYDAQRLVIAPIERMMKMVEQVAEFPLAEFHHFDNGEEQQAAGQYETKLLESTITKITSLLRVGFGEAGAGIISANLRNKDNSAAINPLLPGVRVYAIFGFCDIHHFEEINRKLERDVLVFVNRIAEIVHCIVHTWSGQCNKNLGNAFVIVWRINDEQQLLADAAGAQLPSRGRHSNVASVVSQTSSTASLKGPFRVHSTHSAHSLKSSDDNLTLGSDHGSANSGPRRRNVVIDLRRVPGVDILADKALIGYCKIIAEINRNKNVIRYRNEPRLQDDHDGHPFKVRMGFGLHAGWAIEGAVGSLQKVDATYLSPHVNMAARLETSSKQYGVPLLASQDFYDLMSNEGQAVCRKLDVVTVKGSEVPIGIYTYDALQDQEFKDDLNKQRPSLQTAHPSGSSTTGGGGAGLTGSTGSSHGISNTATPAATTSNSSNEAVHNDAAGHSSTGATNTTTALTSSQPPAATVPGPAATLPSVTGTATPPRRPSITLLPGVEKPVEFFGPLDHPGDVFESDYDMITLRQHVQPEFLDAFKEGVQLYISGDWAAAKILLIKANAIMAEAAPVLGGDGPSQTLLSYMSNQNFEAPKNWKGYRPLTSK